MRATAYLAAAAFALLACTSPLASSPSPTPDKASPSALPASPSPAAVHSPSPIPSPAPPTSLGMEIIQSEYGHITVLTEPGASCSARAIMPTGQDAGGLRNPQTAGSDGNVSWTYPTPPASDGTGTHLVSCSNGRISGSGSVSFTVGA